MIFEAVVVAKAVDDSIALLAILVPPVAVVWRGSRGIILGTIAGWGWIIIASIALELLDPESRNGFTTFFNLLWVAIGSAFILMYCLVIYGIRLAALALARWART